MNKEKFVLPENIYIEKFDVYVKPYLTLEDIADVAEDMMSAEDWCMMEVALNQGIVSHCVVDAEQFNGMDYEVMKQCGFFDIVKFYVANIKDVDEYIKTKTSVNVLLGEFLRELTKTVNSAADNLTNSDKLEKLMEQLKDIQKK